MRATRPLLAVLLLACDDPLGPRDVAGTYALERIGDATLPAVSVANEAVLVRTLADTLRLERDGRGSAVLVTESLVTATGAREGPSRAVLPFDYRVVAGRIEIGFDCPPTAFCSAPPHLVAVPIAGGLRADFAGGRRVPMVYAAVGRAR
jgi:hypothetical protein